MTTETQVDTAALDAWLAEHLFDEDEQQLWRVYGPGLATTGDGELMVKVEMREKGWDCLTWTWARTPTCCAALFVRPWNVHRGFGDGASHNTALPTAVSLAAKAALEAE